MPETGPIVYAGIPVGARRLGDGILSRLPKYPDFTDQDGYEEALISTLNARVQEGDTVVIVGGGVGVTCVAAAKAAGPRGRVICFEGDAAGVAAVRKTAEISGVSDRITVHHAIVGEAIGVYGSAFADKTVTAEELPICDVLELDCEGSEFGILGALTQRPRIIAVETHGFLGAPTKPTSERLASLGYAVSDIGWAEPRVAEWCEKGDIRVLVGSRR